MDQYQKDWEAVNEVLGRWAFHPNEAEEMAKRIAELEAYIEKREEYVEFLVKDLGDVKFDLMMAQNN